MSVVTSATIMYHVLYRCSYTLCVNVSNQRNELCKNDIADTVPQRLYNFLL